MTPIQTHEKELRAMMERAGLASAVRGTIVGGQAPGKDWSTPIAMVTEHPRNEGMFVALYGQTDDSPRHTMDASHPDPRIALRHCLEMAGLLVDRPPQTDAELMAWLTERAGPADSMNRWSHNDYIIRQLDHVWAYWHQGRPLQRSAYVRELGAILWTAERFPEVNP